MLLNKFYVETFLTGTLKLVRTLLRNLIDQISEAVCVLVLDIIK